MSAAPFPTTRRSVVLALSSGDADARDRAFSTIVDCYWRPLYKYARVAWRKPREEAEDLTQSFFLRALEKESLGAYDPSKGGFRTFLRLLFDRYASNERKAGQRIKRGGEARHLDFDDAEIEIGSEGRSGLDPEQYFHQEWVRSVFGVAVERLRTACQGEGRSVQFSVFQAYDLDDEGLSYREVAQRLGIAETQVTNHLSAMRRRFRLIVLEALRELTASEKEFRSEARALLGEAP